MDFKKVCETVKQQRPPGHLINGGHIHLGRHDVSGFTVDVEADIETLNTGAGVRVLIMDGDSLVYTTRLVPVAQVWYAADRYATLRIGTRTFKLGEARFAQPQMFARWYFDVVYKPVSTRSLRYVGETV